MIKLNFWLYRVQSKQYFFSNPVYYARNRAFFFPKMYVQKKKLYQNLKLIIKSHNKSVITCLFYLLNNNPRINSNQKIKNPK